MAEMECCPMCKAGEIERSAGRLDQSGETYLPTVRWACGTCEWTRYEPAIDVRWCATHAPQEP